jgi:hypothetical protein
MNTNTTPSDKSYLATGLLSIFAGFCGAHRFYLGKVGTGLLQLLTFGGCGLWWLIDIALVLFSPVKDSKMRLVKKDKKSSTILYGCAGAVVAIWFITGSISAVLNNPVRNYGDPVTFDSEAVVRNHLKGTYGEVFVYPWTEKGGKVVTDKSNGWSMQGFTSLSADGHYLTFTVNRATERIADITAKGQISLSQIGYETGNYELVHNPDGRWVLKYANNQYVIYQNGYRILIDNNVADGGKKVSEKVISNWDDVRNYFHETFDK